MTAWKSWEIASSSVVPCGRTSCFIRYSRLDGATFSLLIAFLPKFKHKVSSNITVKDELTGNKNPEIVLVFQRNINFQRYGAVRGIAVNHILEKPL
mgnify:CR=1 FL=1